MPTQETSAQDKKLPHINEPISDADDRPYISKDIEPLAGEWFASAGVAVSTSPSIICAYSDRFHNKTPIKPQAWAYGWKNKTFSTSRELAELLRNGLSICTGELKSAYRCGNNVKTVYLVGTDHDGASVEKLLKHKFVQQYAAIVYETSSSTVDAPRSRALYILDLPISPSQFRVYIRRLLVVFGQDTFADPKCTDPSRIWHGSTQPNYRIRDILLPVAVLDSLSDPLIEDKIDFLPLSEASQSITEQLHSYYYNPKKGRNSSLFACACIARDYGLSQADCAELLVHVYASEQPRPVSNPKQEPYAERVDQANATIRSVYSSPRRPPQNITCALPNPIFEFLASKKQHNVARIYEGLLIAGFQPSQSFFAKDAISALLGIGSNTIRAALKAKVQVDVDLDSGEILFISPFCHTHPTPTAVVQDSCRVRGADRRNNLSKRGRPAGSGEIFTFPSIAQLADMLGITLENEYGDSVDQSDLQSAKAYRQSKHEALIARNPDTQYSMKLLRERLGVGTRTVRRYNRAAKIVATPVYGKTKITWTNVDKLPYPDEKGLVSGSFVGGLFIEDATDVDPVNSVGKKYPPRKGIALKLLGEGRKIYLTRQEPNSYIYKPKTRRSTPIIKFKTATYTSAHYRKPDAQTQAECKDSLLSSKVADK